MYMKMTVGRFHEHKYANVKFLLSESEKNRIF